MRSGTRALLVALVACAAMAVVRGAWASSVTCDVSWAAAVDGSWTDATKWDTGAVPTSSQKVCISIAGEFTVTVPTARSVHSLVLGTGDPSQHPTLEGSRVTVSGGRFEWASGTLTAPVTVASFGPTATLDVTSTGPGAVVTEGNVSLTGALAAGQTVSAMTSSCSASTLFVPGGFVNAGTIELTGNPVHLGCFNDRPATLESSGTIVNSGTIRIDPTGGFSRHIRVVGVTNTGLVDIDAATTFSAPFGQGTVDNTGTIDVTPGAHLSFNSFHLRNLAGGTMNVPGATNLSLASSNLVLAGTLHRGTGTLSMSGGTLDWSADDLGEGPVTLTGSPTLTLTSPAPGRVAADGNITLTHDLLAAHTIAATTQSCSAATLIVPAGFVNAGTIELTGDPVHRGCFNDRPATLQSAGAVTNQGTIRVLPTGGFSRVIRVAGLVNTGLLDLETATAFQSPGGAVALDNTGTIDVTPGAHQSFSSFHLRNLAGGTLNVPGATNVALASSDLTLHGTLDRGTGALTIAGGTFDWTTGELGATPVDVTGNITLNLRSTAPITVVAEGVTTLTGNLAAGQTIVNRTHSCGGPTLVVPPAFVNAGTIELTGDPVHRGCFNDRASTLQSSGSITNTGTLRVLPTGGFSRRIVVANLRNDGIVDLQATTDFSPPSGKGAFTNNGTVDVTAGATQVFRSFSLVNGASSTLRVPGATGLVLSGSDLTLAGALTPGTGVIDLSDGAFSWSSGDLSTMPVRVSGTTTLDLTATGPVHIRVRNLATLTRTSLAAGQGIVAETTGCGGATLQAPAGFTNHGTIDLAATTLEGPCGFNSTTTLSAAGAFTNAGLLRVSATGGFGRTITASLFNTGTVVVERATFWNGALRNQGIVDVAPGAHLSFESTHLTNEATGTLNVPGATALTLSNGNLTLAGALTPGTGVIGMTNGTFSWAAGDLSTMPVRVNGSTTLDITATGPVAVRVRGVATLARSSLAAGQTIVVETNGCGEATLQAPAGFTNHGTIDLTATSLEGPCGFNHTTTLSAPGTFTNAGILRVSATGGLRRTITAAVVNTGTFVVERATSFTGGFTVRNQSLLDVADGVQLTFSSTHFVNDATGTLNLPGTAGLSVTSADLTLAGAMARGAGPISLTSGTFVWSGGELGQTPVDVNGSTTVTLQRVAPIHVHARGTTTLTNGLGAGQTVTAISHPCSQATLVVAGGAVNDGTIDLTSESGPACGGDRPASLTVSPETAAFVNRGTVNVLSAHGFSRRVTGHLRNEGRLVLQTTLLVTRSFAQTTTGDVVTNVSPASFGRLQVTTSAALDGDLLPRHIGGFVPTSGQTLNGVVTYGSRTGTFARVANHWTQSFPLTTSMTLTAAPPTECDVRWLGDTDGRWDDPTRWSGGAVPTTADTACIIDHGLHTVTVPADATVGGLRLGGGFDGRVPSLGGAGALTVEGGTLHVVNGSLGAAAHTVDDGTIRLDDTGAASLVATGSTTLASSLSAAHSVVVDGTCATPATLTAPAAFANAGVIELRSSGADTCATTVVTLAQAGATRLTNTGTIRTSAGPGGARLIAASVDNAGVLDLDAPSAFDKAQATIANTGTITAADGADLTFGRTFLDNDAAGTVTLAGDADLVLDGTSSDPSGVFQKGTFSQGTGGIQATDANVIWTTGAVGDGGLTLGTSTLDWTGGSLGATVAAANSDLAWSASAPVAVTVTGIASIRGASGAAAQIHSGQSVVVDAGDDCDGTLDLGAALVNDGSLTITGTEPDLPCGNPFRITLETLTNNGTLAVTGTAAAPVFEAGRITNAGTIDLDAPAKVAIGDGIDNVGTGTVDLAPGVTLTLDDADLANAGTLVLAAGSEVVTDSGDLRQSGAITAAAGSTIRVAQGAVDWTAGDLGAGLLVVDGGSLDWSGGSLGTNAAQLESSRLDLGATAPGRLRVSGFTQLTGTVAAGQSVVVEAADCTGDELVAGGVVNDGTIELVGDGDGSSSCGQVLLSGDLTNHGTLLADVAPALSPRITAFVDDHGWFVVGRDVEVAGTYRQHEGATLQPRLRSASDFARVVFDAPFSAPPSFLDGVLAPAAAEGYVPSDGHTFTGVLIGDVPTRSDLEPIRVGNGFFLVGMDADTGATVRYVHLVPPVVIGAFPKTGTSDTITISWAQTATSSATGHELRRATSRTGPFEPVTVATGFTHEDSGLTPGTRYFYTLATVTPAGTSTATAVFSARTNTPPPATSITSLTAGTTTATVTWQPVSGVTQFDVVRSSVDGVVVRRVQDATSFTDTNLRTGTQHQYVVRTVGSGGATPSASSAVTTSGPVAPTITATTRDARTVAVEWGAVTDATGYWVYRIDGGTLQALATTTSTTFVDATRAPGSTADYLVRSRSLSESGGPALSGPSNRVTSTTPPLPAAPANLRITGRSSTSLSVAWDAVADAQEYRLYWQAGGAFFRGTTTSRVITGLTPSTTYLLTVEVVTAAGRSPRSPELSATTPPTPSVPVNLAATATSGSTATITWDAVGDATRYEVRRRTPTTAFLLRGSPTTNRFDDTNMVPGTTYTYVVQSVTPGGTSARSTELSLTMPRPPGRPTNVAASTGQVDRITVSWTAPAGATGYLVSRFATADATTPVGDPAVVEVTGTSFVDTVTPNTTRFYEVQAKNVAGASTPSPRVSGRTAPPQPPANLRTTRLTSSSVDLAWDAVPSASAYTVFRSTVAGDRGTAILGTGQTSGSDSGLRPGSTYYYSVLAHTPFGDTARTAQLEVETPPLPAPPTNVRAESATASTIRVRWDAAPGGGTYKLYRSLEGSTDTTQLVHGSLTDSAFTVTGLRPSTSYTFAVRVVQPTGTSRLSAPLTTSTMAVAPVPSNLHVTGTTSTSVGLAWTAVADATHYRVLRATTTGGPYTLVATPTTASFTDTGRTPSTTYFYVVQSVTPAGTSARSAEVGATTTK